MVVDVGSSPTSRFRDVVKPGSTRLVRDEEIAGSNPAIPTGRGRPASEAAGARVLMNQARAGAPFASAARPPTSSRPQRQPQRSRSPTAEAPVSEAGQWRFESSPEHRSRSSTGECRSHIPATEVQLLLGASGFARDSTELVCSAVSERSESNGSRSSAEERQPDMLKTAGSIPAESTSPLWFNGGTPASQAG